MKKSLIALILAVIVFTSQAHALIDEDGKYYPVHEQKGFYSVDVRKLLDKGEVELGEIYDNPIFEDYRYTALRKLKVRMVDLPHNTVGQVGLWEIKLDRYKPYSTVKRTPQAIIRSLLHELQHHIVGIVTDFESEKLHDSKEGEQITETNELVQIMEWKYNKMNPEQATTNTRLRIGVACKLKTAQAYCSRLNNALLLFNKYVDEL